MKKNRLFPLVFFLLYIGCHWTYADANLSISNYLNWVKGRESLGGHLEAGYLSSLPVTAWEERNNVIDYLKGENLRSSEMHPFFLIEKIRLTGSNLVYEYVIVEKDEDGQQVKSSEPYFTPNLWPVKQSGAAYFERKFSELSKFNSVSHLGSTSPVFYLIAHFDGITINYYMAADSPRIFQGNLDIEKVEPKVAEAIEQAYIITEIFSIVGLRD